ncbi:MAG: hypothetical protein J6N74_01065 [Chryseobacterium sp.]|nr:hypothetical protein [Chryseobacterium sp.]
MKTNILIVSTIALGLISCKKNEESKIMQQTYSSDTELVDNNGKIDSATTTSMEKDINGKKMTTVSYPYKASDGSRAKATFINDGKSKTITIEANKMKYVLDYKGVTAKQGQYYERNSIVAEATEDSLLITQGNNVIHLEKVK